MLLGCFVSVVACSSLSFGASPSTPTSAPQVDKTLLEQDAAILKRAFIELHPGLNRYLTPRQFEEHYQALLTSLRADPTLRAAYVAFSRFAASIRCGHTHANFFNQKRAVRDAVLESTPRTPFYFEWVGDRMIVTRDLSARGEFPRGTEILQINDVRVARIQKALLPLMRADGGNDAKRRSLLNVEGATRYEAFDVYYPLLFQASSEGEFLVRGPGNRRTRSIRSSMMSFAERAALLGAFANTDGDAPLFEWTQRADGLVLLKMPTWSVYNTRWDWKGWLTDHLDSLATSGAPGLIIDLRGNEGGREAVGYEILRRLIEQPLPLNAMQQRVRYRKVSQELEPYLDTWDPSFKDWGARAVASPTPPSAPRELQSFALLDEAGGAAETLEPADARYTGPVLVMIDASNSSATFQFAQIAQAHGLATLAGSASGGNLRGINGGAYFFVRLPHSAIEVDVPLIGYFPETRQPDAGLRPDLPIPSSVATVAGEKDVELEEAVSMWERRRAK